MGHIYTRTPGPQLYDASRFRAMVRRRNRLVNCTPSHSVKPAIADDIQKIVDTTAEVLGKRYSVNVFSN